MTLELSYNFKSNIDFDR